MDLQKVKDIFNWLMKDKKRLLIAAGLLLILVLIFFFWRSSGKAPSVKFAEVGLGEVASAVSCSGVVKSESADLSSKIGGKVIWLGVDVGTRVFRGQVLVKLDSYDNAKRQFESISNLYSQGLASKSQLDDARTMLESASLVSPIDGVVVKKSLMVGEVASPSFVVVSVVNPQNTWVDVEIDEIDIGSVKEGEEARIYTDAYPDDVFFGKVLWISRAAQLKDTSVVSADEEEKVFKAKVSLLNPDGRLKHGMTVDVDIVFEKKAGIIMVPREAVLFKDSEAYCFVLRGSRVYERDIVIGIKDLMNVEILKGLSAGERVAISSFDKLKNRTKVKVQK